MPTVNDIMRGYEWFRFHGVGGGDTQQLWVGSITIGGIAVADPVVGAAVVDIWDAADVGDEDTDNLFQQWSIAANGKDLPGGVLPPVRFNRGLRIKSDALVELLILYLV